MPLNKETKPNQINFKYGKQLIFNVCFLVDYVNISVII